MTITLPVAIPGRGESYDLIIGKSSLSLIPESSIIQDASKIFALFDASLPQECVSRVHAVLGKKLTASVSIPAGEHSKGTDSLVSLWRFLSTHKADRRSLLLNVGGGMIGDLGGFAASTFMRGIPFIQVPTTLLSQVDASIGGKVAVNFDGIKNLLGTITQPRAVVIDIDFLSTLPKREFKSGFAEIIKHGAIKDRTFATRVFAKDVLTLDEQELESIIVQSCEIKRAVVQADPFENGERKILNFGHTVGHALESLSHDCGSPLLHGEAVALGMIAEAHLAEMAGVCSKDTYETLFRGIKDAGLVYELQERFALSKILDCMKRDKKNSGDTIMWSLISGIGTAVYNREIDTSLVEKSLKATCAA